MSEQESVGAELMSEAEIVDVLSGWTTDSQLPLGEARSGLLCMWSYEIPKLANLIRNLQTKLREAQGERDALREEMAMREEFQERYTTQWLANMAMSKRTPQETKE